MFSINSHAVADSPFISVDEGFVEREEKRVKIAEHALDVFGFILLSIVITIQGLAFLFSFSSNAFIITFAVLSILIGAAGIIYFGFLLGDAIGDLNRVKRRKRYECYGYF